MDDITTQQGSTFFEDYLKLVDDLNHHNFLYHEKNAPLISDTEYDQLYRQLKQIETDNPNWVTPKSPTQRVGYTATGSGFAKFRHPVRMYSLENVFNPTELRKFYKRFSELRRQFSAAEVDQFYVDCKMDGLAVDLIYQEGRLTLGLTRGDGQIGEDVTANLLMIPNIPNRIPTKRHILIRGEVVVHKADFHAINRNREAAGLKVFATTRNYAAGSLRQSDPKVTKERLLRFYGWELIVPDKKYMTHEEQVKKLVDLGFNIPTGSMCYSIEEVISFINEIARIRNELPYDIDGAVIKQNRIEYRKALGWNNHAPLWATAWKFTTEGAETVIERIVWNMGRTGRLTPVAKLKPVNIDGVMVSDVTLHNASLLEESKLGPGAKVRVIRSGDVIPKISEIITSGVYLGLPSTCPFCDAPTQQISTELRCTNAACEETLIAYLKFVVGKDTLDIKGIGESFIREAVASKTITAFKDIFTPIDSKSKTLSQDMLDALVTRVRNVNMMELLIILGINRMGRAIAGKIVMEVLNLKGFIRLLEDSEQMRLLPIGDSIKKGMGLWYANPENRSLIHYISQLQLPYCS